MMKSNNLVLVILAGAILAGCGKADYRKTAGGMPYKIIRGKDTTRVHEGDYVKVSYTQMINDSVYFTTENALPIYLQAKPDPQPYDISEVWTSLHQGDSVVATQMMDTFIKRMPQNIPPEFKNGMRIITKIKILQVFTSDSAVKEDDEKSRQVLLNNEIKVVEKYLADKKITAQKTPSGAFIEIVKPGIGNVVDSGKYVTVNYTGTSWSGKTFDSNTDTSFHHAAPYSYIVGAGRMMKGFDEAVLMMSKGEKIRVYIPSSLGYGANPATPLIKPFEHVKFDLELVDFTDKEPQQPNQPRLMNITGNGAQPN